MIKRLMLRPLANAFIATCFIGSAALAVAPEPQAEHRPESPGVHIVPDALKPGFRDTEGKRFVAEDVAFLTSVRDAPNVDFSAYSDADLFKRRLITCEGIGSGWYTYEGMNAFHVRDGFTPQQARVLTIASILSSCANLAAVLPTAAPQLQA